eukprot:TRINITY_DN3078_c0_g1_i1.p1 TRINITY_DN3078_c0_g1~~TRINITY_DN3078_c0_g1_i1.p1  ORF type:complete len:315 (-),score=55.91 TRINITY_DN3078_c0_g1_i1:95-1039(-)
MDLDEELALFPNVVVPFHTNNVDLSVNANVLFGLTLHFLNVDRGDRQKFDIVKDLYVDIAKFLKWAVERGVAFERPDLSLVYYPSKFDFYWFLARSYAALKAEKDLPFPEMEEVFEILSQLLTTTATNQILEEQGNEGYWQEFLGNYAGKERGEDRLFATAVALNSLLDIWRNNQDTPTAVKESIKKGISYLQNNVLNCQSSKQNAFFSGSLKTNSTFPFFYPSTVSHFINGTEVDPKTADQSYLIQDLIYAFKGYTSLEQYQKMTQEKHFGTPMYEFKGFNQPGGIVFPYWSSPAITYSMTMLAYAKYLHSGL